MLCLRSDDTSDKRTNRTKIAYVLSLMEEHNIKASIITYGALINAKGQSNDIAGMEQVFETMKLNGVEPNEHVLASLSRHYATAGLKDKAESSLKELEGDDIKNKRWVCRYVLPIYASLGRADEVKRIWKVCESKPRLLECIAAIGAWDKLKRIEDAEAIFEKMLTIFNTPYTKHYKATLNMYTNHNMLAKGKDLVARLEKRGGNICPGLRDALVKFYVRCGEIETAMSVLKTKKAREESMKRPFLSSYLTILEHCAEKGDVDNAEKMFSDIRRIGYPCSIRSNRLLLYAYVNAKTPADKFAERLAADSVVPTKEITLLLAQVDSFTKSSLN